MDYKKLVEDLAAAKESAKDYKQRFEETFEQLYLMRVRLQEYEVSEDTLYKILTMQESVIKDLHKSAEKATGERKDKAEDMLIKLVMVYKKIGNYYTDKMKYLIRCKEQESALLEAADKIRQLENELDMLKKIDNL